jgi:uncharacterized protein
MQSILIYVLVGLFAGIMSGLLGIGGGIIVIPALVFLFGLSQHQAQGTTLAMLVPPIGLLAAYSYYKAGHVDLRMAAFLCLGFFFGGFFGAKLADVVPEHVLKVVFGVFMIAVSIKMIFSK